MIKKTTNQQLIRWAPNIVFGALLLLVIGSVVVGGWLGAYEKFWWWDDMLHTASGVIIGLIGFLMVYLLNRHYQMTMSPKLVAVFAFTFAVTIGVAWEIVEFTIDATFGTHMQRWGMPSEILIGRAYQGSGLRDTMSDLIVSTIGAFVASTFGYFTYKRDKPAVLRSMRRTAIKLRLQKKP